MSSLSVVEKFSTKKPVVYVAVAEGQSIEVWTGVIDGEIKDGLKQVLRVPEA